MDWVTGGMTLEMDATGGFKNCPKNQVRNMKDDVEG